MKPAHTSGTRLMLGVGLLMLGHIGALVTCAQLVVAFIAMAPRSIDAAGWWVAVVSGLLLAGAAWLLRQSTVLWQTPMVSLVMAMMLVGAGLLGRDVLSDFQWLTRGEVLRCVACVAASVALTILLRRHGKR